MNLQSEIQFWWRQLVNRALLTPNFVDGSEPPSKGEVWIADTKQKGFGLRLWKVSGGDGQKAYCIRVIDDNRKAHRKTLNITEAYCQFREIHSIDFLFRNRIDPTFGELLEIARPWAYDEINKLKGRPTFAEEDRAQRIFAQSRIETYSFGKAANLLIRGMRENGYTQAYCDRLDKLFNFHVEGNLAGRKITEINLGDIENVLNSREAKPGNLKILRPFLRRIVETVTEFGVETELFPTDVSDLPIAEIKETPTTKQLRNWTEADYQQFLDYLANIDKHWQQGICLRLYLNCHEPLSQMMAARWDHMYKTTAPRFYDPSQKQRPAILWRRESGWRTNIVFKEEMADLIYRCMDIGSKHFDEPKFVFPTKFGRRVGHIRSVDHVWMDALYKFGLSYITPRLFHTIFHETHPWFDFR